MNETKYWVVLSMVFGAASRRLWQLMCLYETAEEAYESLMSGDPNVHLTETEIRDLNSFTPDQAMQIMEHCARCGIDVIGYRSPDYPAQLRRIADPPAVLYVRGNIDALKGRMTVTSVGTRKASQYSLDAAEKICGELAERGVVIVSGFAMGLDIASHMAAASRNKPTVCVLGCGVDVDYPKQNFMYRDRILAAGGAFVSEYPPGTPPHQGNFPKRNRILSALGRAAIVFEASEKSGSLITASLAAEQGRTVFCMPPSDIFSGAFSGNIRLLKEGAIPLFGADDVMSCFAPGNPIRLDIRREAFDMLRQQSADRSRSKNKPVSSITERLDAADPKPETHRVVPVKRKTERPAESGINRPQKQEKENSAPQIKLEGVQKKIADLLIDGALHADLIAQRLELDAGELLVELTELEIMGVIRSLPGRCYEIK